MLPVAAFQPSLRVCVHASALQLLVVRTLTHAGCHPLAVSAGTRAQAFVVIPTKSKKSSYSICMNCPAPGPRSEVNGHLTIVVFI